MNTDFNSSARLSTIKSALAPTSNAAAIVGADQVCRIGSSHHGCVADADAGFFDHDANAVEHRNDAARERAVIETRGTVANRRASTADDIFRSRGCASATLSLTRMIPSLPRALTASRSIAGCTWTPSGMSAATAGLGASAAAMTPGSRWFNGRIALNRCVNMRAPASMPAFASSSVALVWPIEATTPRAVRRRIASSAAGQLGRRV